MKIDWKSPKKKLWLLNSILYNLYRLIPNRDKKIWVFGAWEGLKYDDNSKALFEYINQNYSDEIRCVWISNKESVVAYVKSIGYEAYLSTSKEGKKIQKKSGVAIYTHGLMDFGWIPRIAGSYIVSLWHGVGFKKTYNEKYIGWKLFVKESMDKVFSWTHRDLTIVTSEAGKRQFTGIFGLKKQDKVVTAGQPRNDIFKQNLTKNEVFHSVGFDINKRIVLYMPTYRSNGLEADAMDKIILNLYNSKTLQDTLNATNSVLLIKLHPLCKKINIENREDFYLMNSDDVKSIQELLAVSDVLVTDYSSCIVDFALTRKPVIFYAPDYEDFVSKSESLYEEFFILTKNNCCYTIEELSTSIQHTSTKIVSLVNELFEDSMIQNTCYSENVFQAIKRELSI